MLDEWNRSEGNAFAAGQTPFDLEFDDFELLQTHRVLGNRWRLLTSTMAERALLSAVIGPTTGNLPPETTFDLIAPGHGGNSFAVHVGGRSMPPMIRVTAKFRQDGSPVDLSIYAGIRFWVRATACFAFTHFNRRLPIGMTMARSTARIGRLGAGYNLVPRLRQEGWEYPAISLLPNNRLSIENVPAAGFPHRPASGLYRGMIAPLLPFPFRGVIWYQGESNALQAPAISPVAARAH